MGYANFIPTIWSARLLLVLRKQLVYGQEGVVNRNYEGEISAQGDRVKINSFGKVTVKDYVRNTDIADPELLNNAQQELVVDQAKYFNFAVDDVDQLQANVDLLTQSMDDAGYELRDVADQFIAALMAANVPTANTIGTVGAPITDLTTAANAYKYLVQLGVKLDEANTPSEGRWAIVPPWFHGVLLQDDRFVSFGTAATDQRLRNGMVGEAAGFTVLKSNNVPNDTGEKFRIMAGYGGATSYAEQLLKMEAYRIEKRFSDAIKGLHVYGAKVVRPSSLAMLIANQPS